MDARYAKPPAMHPRMRAQLEATAKAEGKKPEPEPKKKPVPPPKTSELAVLKKHIVDNKPNKKEVLEYFQKMCDEIAAKEEED